MTRFNPFLAGAALLFTLAGCASSPPVHYHTLSAPAGGSDRTASTGQPASFAFELLPVGIPAQLDQERVVVRENATGLVIRDSERWTGPYADEIRNALAVQLAAGLYAQDVTGLGKTAGQQVMRVQVQVRRFDAWVGGKVSFDATWRLGMVDAPGDARVLCASRFDVPAAGGYPELVRAQQVALAKLAAEISGTARAWDGRANGQCARLAP
jgi:uncharacterized lipoprotein YmbA